MSKRQGGWKRQSWQDAEREIGQAVGLTVQAADQIVLIPDEQLEDSPYQARAGYDDAQIADLAQGMRESGFQGVLFVRPHPGGPRDGRPRYQLVFGHRRRRAWRLICAERGQPCALPAVVREVGDRQLLTIGAQENLQREDLNPVEEARLVLWHQELYYPASLAEIGRMLGKSEDWAKTRSRVAQLPEPLAEVIRRSPQLMTGVLEISRLWDHDPTAAREFAEYAEREGLTLKQIREVLGDVLGQPTVREEKHERRVDALTVTDFTSSGSDETPAQPTIREEKHERRVNALTVTDFTSSGSDETPAQPTIREEKHERRVNALTVTDFTSSGSDETPAQPTIREEKHERRVNALTVTDFTSSGSDETSEQRIAAETERMLAQLHLWEQLVADPARRELIARSCERLLSRLQLLVARLEAGD